MSRRALVMLCLLLCVAAFFSSAQDGWDATQSWAYMNSSFYEQVGPADWDYRYVQWEQVPDSAIGSIPAGNLRFDKMKSSQLWVLTSDQVSQRITDIEPEQVSQLSDSTIGNLTADDAGSYLDQQINASRTGSYHPQDAKEWRLLENLFPNMDDSLYTDNRSWRNASPLDRPEVGFRKEGDNYAVGAGPSDAVLANTTVPISYAPIGTNEHLKVGNVTAIEADIVADSADKYQVEGDFYADDIGLFTSSEQAALDSTPGAPDANAIAYHDNHLQLLDSDMSLIPDTESQVNYLTIRNTEGSTSVGGEVGWLMVQDGEVMGKQNPLDIGMPLEQFTNLGEDSQMQQYATDNLSSWYPGYACSIEIANASASNITGLAGFTECGDAGPATLTLLTEARESQGAGLSELAVRQMPPDQKVAYISSHDPSNATPTQTHDYERTVRWCYGSPDCRKACQNDSQCRVRITGLMQD
jgi:hypothetical protein